MPINSPPPARASASSHGQADHIDVQKAVIARLIEHHGWSGDRILDNLASKDYPTFVGHASASVWVRQDPEYQQVWLTGTFTSAGENVLANCFGCIREPATAEAVHSALDAFMQKAEKAIEGAFSVRVLRARQAAAVSDTQADTVDETEPETSAERNA